MLSSHSRTENCRGAAVQPKIAIVHDWLIGTRGGEHVLEEICALFPEATLFTLFHKPRSVPQAIESMPIRTSFLNRVPGIHRHYRYWLPLYPLAVSRLDLRGFDLILSSSHAVAKGIRKPRGSVHVCYCHTPMRYIWDMQTDYLQYGDPFRIRKAALSWLTHPLRLWDRETASGVDAFIANSQHIEQRIARCYDRSSDVIHPPVDTDFFRLPHTLKREDFFLVVSALVPYKRLDLAVDAFNRLGRPLIVVGTGPDLKMLRKRAARNIQFRGLVRADELRNLYQRCRALVIPGQEDFGIVSVEAQACGAPVIAYGAGGSLESVVDGKTGILFSSQTVPGLMEAVRRLDQVDFNPAELRSQAERFSRDHFRASFREAVEKAQTQSARLTVAARTVKPHPSLAGLSGFSKRCIDILLASAGLALLAPLIVLLALLVRSSSPGPAFFCQRRLGLYGRTFVMVKLRTMYENAEQGRGPTWSTRGDSRCTPLGSFLRRWGLDELPQLWNVIKGEMSLVGPRPERPEFLEALKKRLPGFERRLEVRGGLTGLAQIRGWRGNTSLRPRLTSDLEYTRCWSLGQDLSIILRTPAALLRQGSSPVLLVRTEASAATRHELSMVAGRAYKREIGMA